MWLLILFIAIPILEISLFLQVGGIIGFWPTIAIVIATAFLGTYLVRQQGMMALGQISQTFQTMENPVEPLAHGAMILLSGALLVTPGFFTDAVGFALLVPAFRSWAFAFIRARVKVQSSFTMHSAGASYERRGPGRDDGVIDGEFEDVTPQPKPTHTIEKGPSGWTKH